MNSAQSAYKCRGVPGVMFVLIGYVNGSKW